MGFTFVILGILTMVSIVLPVNYSIYAVVLTITVVIIETVIFMILSNSNKKEKVV